MRIASFLPAGTTICYELGLGDKVSCVTFECQFPPAAKDKPKVIRCIFNSDDLTSAEIENAVNTNLAASVPLYEIDESLLEDVDVVLIQDLCEVCAIGPPMVLAALDKLKVQPRVLYLTARSLDGLYNDIMTVATGCDIEGRGVAMVTSMKARVDRVERALVDCTPVKTVCVEWLGMQFQLHTNIVVDMFIPNTHTAAAMPRTSSQRTMLVPIDPIYNAGHWMPDLVHRAGGYDPLAAPESFSVAINWSHVAEAGAELLVIMPCGFDLARTIKDATDTLPPKSGWRDIPAVQNRRVWAFDGNRLFSGASPALVDGLEILASVLHPELYTLEPTLYSTDFALVDI
ncbi:hypothetical protein AaE_011888 [Aphanomyces astaci]|uniref:Fe/B12 periplasmic-binding domain-containing protein n=1 Tax=Aphanomyces astaci TaxID=112090 RepID=A0A6A4ZKS3_APHAT|nr:hypothetical protein AaE_011888 [Aphanomyces astaci]